MSDSGENWRASLRPRVLVVAGLLGLWVVAIEARLVYLQVARRSDLVARAELQQRRRLTSPGKRGDILDRSGRVLATSVDADSIYAVPSVIGDAARTVFEICAALGDCTAAEQLALTDRLEQPRAFAWIRRQVPPDAARRVGALNLEGIGFVKESRRFYPNKELAAHLIGYVGIDGTGLSGLEWAYDSQIRGKAGTMLIQTDARRHAFNRFERPPTSGSTVELTIDQYLQHVAERELHAGVAEHAAAGGAAIVMDPRTGEILALANEPTFNPNAYREFPEIDRRNRAVQDLYEPGSTFKVVTASAAIDGKVMPTDTLIDTNPGEIRIGSRVVHDTRNHGVLSFSDVIVESSNVGAIKIGLKVGTERLSDYVKRYGFGRAVSPDFPGENTGIVWNPDKWTDSALASVSMGYQIGVTPLQMVAAVSSVANLGQYVEPRAMRAAYRDGRRYGVQPKVVRRTISADTAAVLTTIMEGVVERGTARSARIPGFTIAGKTGTAHKLVDGRYSKVDYNASFVGFLPSRHPGIAIIVVIDSPHSAAGYFGGSVAAPVFKRIAESALHYLGIGPTINPPAPVLVAREAPADGPLAPAQAAPIVSLVAGGPAGIVPDLHGMSARDALRRLVKAGLAAHLEGDGVVVSQDPPAGAPLEPGDLCRLVLSRSPLSAGQVAAR